MVKNACWRSLVVMTLLGALVSCAPLASAAETRAGKREYPPPYDDAQIAFSRRWGPLEPTRGVNPSMLHHDASGSGAV